MTPEQRDELRLGLESLMPLPKSFGAQFYERLFELDPGLRPLFKGDIERQATMLTEALTTILVHLMDEGAMSEKMGELGIRHRGYGLLDRDWDTFGEALMQIIEQRLKSELPPGFRALWSETWDEIARAMQTAQPDEPEGG